MTKIFIVLVLIVFFLFGCGSLGLSDTTNRPKTEIKWYLMGWHDSINIVASRIVQKYLSDGSRSGQDSISVFLINYRTAKVVSDMSQYSSIMEDRYSACTSIWFDGLTNWFSYSHYIHQTARIEYIPNAHCFIKKSPCNEDHFQIFDSSLNQTGEISLAFYRYGWGYYSNGTPDVHITDYVLTSSDSDWTIHYLSTRTEKTFRLSTLLPGEYSIKHKCIYSNRYLLCTIDTISSTANREKENLLFHDILRNTTSYLKSNYDSLAFCDAYVVNGAFLNAFNLNGQRSTVFYNYSSNSLIDTVYPAYYPDILPTSEWERYFTGLDLSGCIYLAYCPDSSKALFYDGTNVKILSVRYNTNGGKNVATGILSQFCIQDTTK
ncbi:MAG: hypothetical protein JNL74_08110 [Fibrobacteres bacterium]|nr:hypothetical protein [Fibrobacterota bacterium]